MARPESAKEQRLGWHVPEYSKGEGVDARGSLLRRARRIATFQALRIPQGVPPLFGVLLFGLYEIVQECT